MSANPLNEVRIVTDEFLYQFVIIKCQSLGVGKEENLIAELAPKHDEKDGEEVKRDEQPQLSQRVENPAQSSGPKESMVAEPANMPYYKKRIYGFSPSL